jgi:1-hydroxycarotenoid 3,4-desaturase
MGSAARERAVVIGAGVGGLAAAARLARAGLAVTLLDRHPWPGGKMRTLPSPAGPVDAGPTVVTMKPVFEALFADCGARIDDHVSLVPEPLLARHYWPDGATLDLFADPEASAAAVRGFGGARAEADFRAFSATAGRLYRAFDAPMMQAPQPRLGRLVLSALSRPDLLPVLLPGRSLAGLLAGRFADARLAQLFGRYATYVGGSPYLSPAVLGLIWHSEARGVWRVEGGMHRLAAAMLALAESLGVEAELGTGADKIELRDGRVAAVHTADGRRVLADRVVFNGDPRALAEGLLGQGARAAVARRATEPRSQSAYVWAFASTPQGHELAHHTVFFGADPKTEFEALAAGRPPEDPTLYLCAEDRGSGRTPPAIERFEIIMNGPPLTGGPPEEESRCRTRVFDTLAARGLSFAPAPPPAALTDPGRFAALFPGSAGSLYGLSPHGLMAPFARPGARTRIKGLYLAGGGAHPGAGIPMATLSGRHAAEAILEDRASTSPFRRTDTPGGISTASRTTAPARSRSSAS